MKLKLLLLTLTGCGIFTMVSGQTPDLHCWDITDKDKDPAPTLLDLPAYSVRIEANDKDGETLIQEIAQSKGRSAIMQRKQNTAVQWIKKDDNTFYYLQDNGQNCTVQNSTTGNPMDFNDVDGSLTKLAIPLWKNLKELVTNVSGKAMKSKKFINATHEHGLPMNLTHWVGCAVDSTNGINLEIMICYADSSAAGSYKFVDPNGPKFPVRVEVTIFKGKNKTEQNITSWKVYEVFDGKSENLHADWFTMPQHGIYCDGDKTTALPTLLPSRFTATYDYTNIAESRTDSVPLSYDQSNGLIGVEFTYNDEERWFSKGMSLTKGKSYTIVHDFSYGYQYAMDHAGGCKVDALPTGTGDFAPGPSGRLITLKNISDILVGEEMNFANSGPRPMRGGQQANVYVGKGKSSVLEVSFTTDDWTYSNPLASTKSSSLVRLDTYQSNSTSKRMELEISQEIHGIVDFTGASFPWEQMDISPCLNLTSDSYLYFISDTKMNDIQSFGLEQVGSSLREWIATTAKVSPLKIGNFYLKELDDKTTMIFFLLGDKNSMNPTPVVNTKNETTAAVAGKALNETMKTTTAIPLVGFDKSQKMDLKIVKESLQIIPKDFHPSGSGPIPTPTPSPQQERGYTGGSMAALGICMLLIGGVVGLIVAFFLWKRNRGIAYQVYE